MNFPLSESRQKQMEEQEVLNPVPLTPDDVLVWAAEARQQLLDATGVELPQLPVGSVTSKASLAVDWLGVAIPKGVLFYPCCGRDTEDAVRLFGSSVTACHFADPYRTLPGHPRLDRQLQRQIEIRHVGHVVVGPTAQQRVNSVSCPVFRHQKDGLLTLIGDVGSVAVFF